uniref:Uncharacterized protein n=1 Tax=Panagrolaimus superbus TaxID=310955 RepID=A0A914YXH9_9BILA
MNEINQMKLSKARQSLNEAETVRSIVKSLRENSLKHQLTTTARVEREQRQRAQEAVLARGRRGATDGKDLARVKLRKVLMMVRVVNAFRQFADRICSLTPISVIRSHTASPDLSSTQLNNNNNNNGAENITAFPCMKRKK